MISGNFVKIAWFGKHFGEEPPLVGEKGAGTIFFTGCNLRCVYCQNYQISQQNIGKNYTVGELAEIMIGLQNNNALNIDLVTPTIWAGPISQAIIEAKKEGLNIPVVWNSNAYESGDLIKKMEGLVDIYLPDFKYGDDASALKYSGVKNYVSTAREAIKEMFRQVGNLEMSDLACRQAGNFTATKGVFVRHLVLPGNVENSLRALEYIKEIDKDICVNLLSQYEPVHKAKDFPEINRTLEKEEFEEVFNYLLALGLENGYVQEAESHAVFLPDFTKENPFG